ncbi:MAG: DNA polymerase III subunit gamma/tau [Candidatus Cloacimonetes bacterium]|nr:DNA polymerase III subunit gamma/tau [Candidatus Cloacimonadota bacterium]
MSYVVLARKYRPQTFDEVYAQEHITRTLVNAITMNRIAHAYLFTGPRGVGKTSLARILSKGLNCEHGPTAKPCNVCGHCQEITVGNSQDVIEIDGASNTSVDDVRELQKELLYATAGSSYKIYIIDEVHMLSKSAFNALLKTLEEPPDNVVFIFATTEPHKIPATIISRCQRYDCRRIPLEAIVSQLRHICEKEGLAVDEDALFTIAKKADGGMRDALSLMDQVISYGHESVSVDDVMQIFGILPSDVFVQLLRLIGEKRSSEIIRLLHEVLEAGNDLQEFLSGFMEQVRNLMLLKLGIEVPEIPQKLRPELKEAAAAFGDNDLLYMLSFILKLKGDIRTSGDPQLVAEMGLIKLARMSELASLDDLIGVLRRQPAAPAAAPDPGLHSVQKEILHMKTAEVKQSMAREVSEEKPQITQLTAETLQEHWDALLGKVSKQDNFVANYLGESEIVGVSNNKVRLRLTRDNHLTYLTRQKQALEDIFSRHFNLDVKLLFEKKQGDAVKEKGLPTLKDLATEAPDLAEFIKLTESDVEFLTPQSFSDQT